jgi:hypothetical protein
MGITAILVVAGAIIYPACLLIVFPKYVKKTSDAVLPTILAKFRK